MGRPRKPRDQLHCNRTEVLLTDAQEARLDELAKKTFRDKSSLLRELAFKQLDIDNNTRVADTVAS